MTFSNKYNFDAGLSNLSTEYWKKDKRVSQYISRGHSSRINGRERSRSVAGRATAVGSNCAVRVKSQDSGGESTLIIMLIITNWFSGPRIFYQKHYFSASIGTISSQYVQPRGYRREFRQDFHTQKIRPTAVPTGWQIINRGSNRLRGLIGSSRGVTQQQVLYEYLWAGGNHGRWNF
jgi:hypothetical protein